MTVEQLKIDKEITERQILKLIKEFEKLTTASISDIILTLNENYSDLKTHVMKVAMKVEIK